MTLAALAGGVAVGEQLHPIGHGHFDIPLDEDVMGVRGREREETREEAAAKGHGRS